MKIIYKNMGKNIGKLIENVANIKNEIADWMCCQVR